MMGRAISRLFVAGALAATLVALPAGRAGAIDAPYEQDMMRLAELLGSLHYLRNLCGETGNMWREEMEGLIAVEAPEAERRARLVASFNRGYRSYDSVYTNCTASAVETIERYMLESQTLATSITTTYGN